MAAPVVPSLIANEPLNKHNYKEWKLRVKTYLQAKGLYSVVRDASDPPQKGRYKREAWQKTNAEALHAIHLCCGNDAFQVIKSVKSAHNAWDALKSEFDHSGDLQTDHDAQPEEVREADEPKDVDKGDGDDNSRNDNTDAEVVNYEDFFRAVKDHKWDTVMDLIKKHREAVTKPALKDDEKTVLHYAVEDKKVEIVKQLMPLIKEKYELDRRDREGYTALEYCYVLPDKDETFMVEIAECLVERKT